MKDRHAHSVRIIREKLGQITAPGFYDTYHPFAILSSDDPTLERSTVFLDGKKFIDTRTAAKVVLLLGECFQRGRDNLVLSEGNPYVLHSSKIKRPEPVTLLVLMWLGITGFSLLLSWGFTLVGLSPFLSILFAAITTVFALLIFWFYSMFPEMFGTRKFAKVFWEVVAQEPLLATKRKEVVEVLKRIAEIPIEGRRHNRSMFLYARKALQFAKRS